MFDIKPYKIAVIYKSDKFHLKRNTYSSDVNTRVLLAKSMPISKFSDDGNRIKTSIFSESRRYDLKRICVRLETVRFHTLQRMSVICQEP